MKDKNLTISVVNPDVSQPREAEIHLLGRKWRRASHDLGDEDIHAHNTFDHPDAVKRAPKRGRLPAALPNSLFPPPLLRLLQLKLA